MLSALDNAAIFLITTLFDLYIFILVMRLVLVAIRADFYNPISKFVTKLTQPVIQPLRRFIPVYKKIELATVLLIVLLEILKYLLLGLLIFGHANLLGLFVLAIADLGKSLLNFFFYCILIQVLMSWIQPGYSPIGQMLTQITSPLMRPAQRLIPPIGGIDISPIPVILLIQLTIILLISPIFSIGQALAFS